ncbi:MAG: helix-turn-helix transcriptional regulator [Ruminococcus sp.]|nr:helix-turn-helix transcriptional regulator [Ruminococcus sp.]
MHTALHQPYISRLEDNGFNLSTQMIVNIAVVLDVSIDYLLLDAEERRAYKNKP